MNIKNLMTFRVIGFCAVVFIWPLVSIAIIIPLIAGCYFQSTTAFIGFAVIGSIFGYLTPAYMGLQYLKYVEDMYGSNVANKLFERFSAVKRGDLPDFSLDEIVRETRNSAS